nr:hypothetical protein [Tanacetum cinerariifolium]
GVTANGLWPLWSRFIADRETLMGISIMRIRIKEIALDSCVAFLVSQRASAEGIRAALLLVGGLESCAFFLATHFSTDVTFHQVGILHGCSNGVLLWILERLSYFRFPGEYVQVILE